MILLPGDFLVQLCAVWISQCQGMSLYSVGSPSSNMSKDIEFIPTNPWDSASNKTRYVDIATRIPEKAASHIALLFQWSILSLLVKERVHMGGVWLFMDIKCCSHRATVGQRSQINYDLLARNLLLNDQLITLSGLPELISSAIRSRALG